jgi:hypothetical protein
MTGCGDLAHQMQPFKTVTDRAKAQETLVAPLNPRRLSNLSCITPDPARYQSHTTASLSLPQRQADMPHSLANRFNTRIA